VSAAASGTMMSTSSPSISPAVVSIRLRDKSVGGRVQRLKYGSEARKVRGVSVRPWRRELRTAWQRGRTTCSTRTFLFPALYGVQPPGLRRSASAFCLRQRRRGSSASECVDASSSLIFSLCGAAERRSPIDAPETYPDRMSASVDPREQRVVVARACSTAFRFVLSSSAKRSAMIRRKVQLCPAVAQARARLKRTAQGIRRSMRTGERLRRPVVHATDRSERVAAESCRIVAISRAMRNGSWHRRGFVPP